jgi:8-oxo-dGTP pyrophosphatase MutT (NUDIX family)
LRRVDLDVGRLLRGEKSWEGLRGGSQRQRERQSEQRRKQGFYGFHRAGGYQIFRANQRESLETALHFRTMSGSPSRERLRRVVAASPADAPLSGARRAAIAVILVELGMCFDVLLIERATREGDPWSGHMALPGGHADPGDPDLGTTAERETLEEVGLDLRQLGERLGCLSDCAPVRAVPIAVRPFVYLLEARPALRLSSEVKQALWVPIAPLLAGEKRTSYSLVRGEHSLKFPAWDIAGHVVWGLTYRVLDELFGRLNGVSGSE